jgi:hypothetical protein
MPRFNKINQMVGNKISPQQQELADHFNQTDAQAFQNAVSALNPKPSPAADVAPIGMGMTSDEGSKYDATRAALAQKIQQQPQAPDPTANLSSLLHDYNNAPDEASASAIMQKIKAAQQGQ